MARGGRSRPSLARRGKPAHREPPTKTAANGPTDRSADRTVGPAAIGDPRPDPQPGGTRPPPGRRSADPRRAVGRRLARDQADYAVSSPANECRPGRATGRRALCPGKTAGQLRFCRLVRGPAHRIASSRAGVRIGAYASRQKNRARRARAVDRPLGPEAGDRLVTIQAAGDEGGRHLGGLGRRAPIAAAQIAERPGVGWLRPVRSAAEWMVDSGRFPPSAVMQLAQRMAASLAEAETIGLVHGDLRAASLMCPEAGRTVSGPSRFAGDCPTGRRLRAGRSRPGSLRDAGAGTDCHRLAADRWPATSMPAAACGGSCSPGVRRWPAATVWLGCRRPTPPACPTFATWRPTLPSRLAGRSRAAWRAIRPRGRPVLPHLPV